MVKKTEHQFILTAKDNTRSATKSSTDNFKEMAATAGTVASTVAGIAVAAGTVAVAVAKMQAEAARELSNLARIGNTTIAEFQRLASATSTVGIESEKLSDILKDTNDRVGDFLQTGAGPMADFFENIAPKVGVTASQFATLSGPQSLQLYIESLNKANLSQAEMTFYMEAIASDSSALLPLYANNSRALDTLTSRYDDLNEELQLTAGQAEDMRELSNTFDLLGETAANAASQLTATLAPELTSFLNTALELLPLVTTEIIDFINSFKEAQNITQIAALERQIEAVNEKIAETTELQLASATSFQTLNDNASKTAEFQLAQYTTNDDRARQATESQAEYNERLVGYQMRLEELQAALANLKQAEVELQETQTNRLQPDTLDIDDDRIGSDPESIKNSKDAELEIADFSLKTWEEMQTAKEQRHLKSLQLQLVAETKHEEEASERHRELLQQRAELEREFTQAAGDLFIQLADQKYQEDLRALRNTEGLSEEEIKSREKAAKESFENSKKLQLGMVGINTAAAVMNELANNPDPWSKWLTVGTIVARGIQSASDINNQKFGGGSSISGTSGGPSGPGFDSGNQTNAVPTGDQIQPTVNVFIDGNMQGMVRGVRTYLAESGDELVPSNSANARRIRSAV